jgi:hypothetical protein
MKCHSFSSGSSIKKRWAQIAVNLFRKFQVITFPKERVQAGMDKKKEGKKRTAEMKIEKKLRQRGFRLRRN